MMAFQRSSNGRSWFGAWLHSILLLHTAAASLRTISGAASLAAAQTVDRYLASLPASAGRGHGDRSALPGVSRVWVQRRPRAA